MDPVTLGMANRLVNARTITDVVTTTVSSILAADKINLVDATAGPLDMTLPTTALPGTLIVIEKTDITDNQITVSGSIREIAASFTMTLARESIELLAGPSGSWYVIGDHKTLSSLDSRIPTLAMSLFPTGQQTRWRGYGSVDPTTLPNLLTGDIYLYSAP